MENSDEEKGFDYDSDGDIETVGDRSSNSDITLAKKETRAIRCFRSILFLVLVVVATLVSVSVFIHERRSEIDHFETDFSNHGRLIVDSFRSNAKRRLKAIDALSSSITSYALLHGNSWPNVTFPDFEREADYTLDLAAILSITFFPIVTNETKAGWEKYSIENQGWLKESLASQQLMEQGPQNDDVLEEENILAIDQLDGDESDGIQFSANIWRFTEDATQPTINETGPGPFSPWWQFAPAFPVASVLNYNLMSNPSRKNEIWTVLETGQATTSPCFDLSDENDLIAAARRALFNLFLTRWENGGRQYQDGPVSDLYTPVYDRFDIPNRSVVALLTSYIYWQVYFADVLPQNAKSVMAILENTCNQSYTYLINGPEVEYIGPGDLHDDKYDNLQMSTGFGAFLGKQEEEDIFMLEGQCMYNVRVYPTKALEEQFITNSPFFDALFLLLTFAFTSFVFLMYDYLVERRQKMVMKTAVQSTEVVDSLFPAVVRDRLYEESQTVSVNNQVDHYPIRNFANFKRREQNHTEYATKSNEAIADIYPNCTVFFADIKGFTSWSAEREPTQVFKLLETLYGAFDKLAKKFKVFKIETIGDSYLAVTGLPEPQHDHALLMAKFASACLMEMNHVKHELSTTLGLETLQLDIRCGLHSGPVTAGVLRGQKARFQLFGDTVNTASRMESTGMPGKIQVSAETAKILQSMGKISWIRKREDLVEAKGKGKLQTYWLEPSTDSSSSTIPSTQTESATKAEF